ncbi:alpha/beta hydrolase domain-containing protein [Planctomicrobium sp. SH527]|uniref:alpha/beta hydrolase domain-containing protein n=1 Tax=Planctomicrobium sp. SH527 TaxID=3448123 RepID=UPI003F5B0D36
MEITERIPFAEGYSFEHTGPYELLRGRMIVELTPDASCNARVHDLKFAARNSRDKVEFWTDFVLLKPVDPHRGNGRLLYDVHNRGNMLAVWTFNSADKITNDPRTLTDAGNGFLMQEGYSVLWTGWNAEVQDDGQKRLILGAPVIDSNGTPLTGRVHVEICVAETMMSRAFGWSPWGMPKVFPSIELDNRHAVLTCRPSRSEPAVEIPHTDWAFARWEEGKLIPDPTQLYVKGGFQPGELYDLVYTAKDPRVAGVGLAGIRDVVSFLRHAKADESGNPNPLAGVIEHSYIFGISQSGRLIVSFIHEGFNADTNGKPVFDGALVHVAGAGKGHFTARFRNATDAGNHHEANWCGSESFPFSPVTQTDPVTGEQGSVLDRARQAGVVPKIIYVQTSTEYWARAASLVHTDVEGKKDLELPENVRLYLTAGSQHLGKGPPTKGTAQQPRNILDDRGPVLRAMLVNLDRWVTVNEHPPSSRYPKISDGGLVDIATFQKQFPKLPGVNVPSSYYRPMRLDFGPRLLSEGIADVIPPQVGQPWTTLVPAVNRDGNEFNGIVLPDVAVPLGTFTGWNLRAKEYGPPTMLTSFDGSFLPFATTAEERRQTGDPRPSIQERYPTRDYYMSEVTEAALDLQRERFLLSEDVVRILETAAQRNLWNQ